MAERLFVKCCLCLSLPFTVSVSFSLDSAVRYIKAQVLTSLQLQVTPRELSNSYIVRQTTWYKPRHGLFILSVEVKHQVDIAFLLLLSSPFPLFLSKQFCGCFLVSEVLSVLCTLASLNPALHQSFVFSWPHSIISLSPSIWLCPSAIYAQDILEYTPIEQTFCHVLLFQFSSFFLTPWGK